MKTFIVGLALIILMAGCMCFSSDMRGYVLAQNKLKTIAEECANAGALQIDYETGIIDAEKAEIAVRRMLEGYPGIVLGNPGSVDTAGIITDETSVTVTLTYYRPFFRIPFVNLNSVTRTSCYAWE